MPYWTNHQNYSHPRPIGQNSHQRRMHNPQQCPLAANQKLLPAVPLVSRRQVKADGFGARTMVSSHTKTGVTQ